MWLLAALFAPLMLQDPSLSETSIAFSWGGFVWTVSRDGGAARQITTAGHEANPSFSPDGKMIAFTGEYDGNVDVFVVPASGGNPRRLTWHPGADTVVGWTRDGKAVLFRSGRDASADFGRLFTVPVEGGFPTPLPMWRAEGGSYSPDGARIAYVPNMQWQKAWKRYRGGQTTSVQIARLSDLEVTKVPRENSNDSNPMWVEDTVYFLSDRSGPVTLFAFDVGRGAVRELVPNQGFDVKSASAGPGAIVYDQFGSLYLYDLKAQSSRRIEVEVAADVPAARPHFEKVASQIQNAAISPSGVRAAFEAHGEIVTVPAEKGDIRNLTSSPAAAERDPAWSSDGQSIAYFSDESGEYQLHIRSQGGLGDVRRINLGSPPSFFYSPLWSPDGKKIAFTDKRRNLWYVEVEKGAPVKVDTDRYEDFLRGIDPSWSPDSRFLAYTMPLENHMRSVFVYSLETGKSTRLTDGMSDARFPVFDRNGEHLTFAASTDFGLSVGWLDLSSYERPVRRSLYVAVLKKGLPSPLAPESDEEVPEPEPKKGEEDEEEPAPTPVVAIDFDGIDQRILALPVPAANYAGMQAGKSGELYLLEQALIPPAGEYPPKLAVHRFRLEDRKTEKLVEGVTAFDLSENGEKYLYKLADKWLLSGTEEGAEPKELALEAMEVYVDPKAEWRQIYRETWRIQRDFLYDPAFHGLDLAAASEKYEGFLERVSSRADLNFLFEEMLGELTLGHVFVQGGDLGDAPKVKGGLLGADYAIENGRYRFGRIFNGESWNPNLRAPLTQPGVEVVEGDYLLEVNGKDVRPPASLYAFFENTAGRQVRLKVGPSADGARSREVTVVPIEDETALRRQAWIEDNRRRVDKLSGGRLAYVHLPDTATGGYTSFNRYFFAQIGKEGAILDERYNQGGSLADYIIDLLKRPLRTCMTTRDGEDYCSPTAAIYGPKTMIINEMAGSGGDALPWMFRLEKLGPLVGKRTWGGLVGIYDYPVLMDGGTVTAPRIAIYGLHGEWEVENVGVAPDVEVENDPKSVAAGRDPQLERAVEITLDALKKQPVAFPLRPTYPNYHRNR